MSYYTDQRDEIKAQLEAVAGIGNVFTRQPNPTDEKSFKDAFVKSSKINSVIITRVDGSDNIEGDPLGSISEANNIIATGKRDNWLIRFLYGYDDHASTPSEDIFQGLVDLIEAKFEYLENLNDKALFSYPLQRTQCGLFVFFGSYLCHKAEWRLQVVNRT